MLLSIFFAPLRQRGRRDRAGQVLLEVGERVDHLLLVDRGRSERLVDARLAAFLVQDRNELVSEVVGPLLEHLEDLRDALEVGSVAAVLRVLVRTAILGRELRDVLLLDPLRVAFDERGDGVGVVLAAGVGELVEVEVLVVEGVRQLVGEGDALLDVELRAGHRRPASSSSRSTRGSILRSSWLSFSERSTLPSNMPSARSSSVASWISRRSLAVSFVSSVVTRFLNSAFERNTTVAGCL